jgi:hypothetical protein
MKRFFLFIISTFFLLKGLHLTIDFFHFNFLSIDQSTAYQSGQVAGWIIKIIGIIGLGITFFRKGQMGIKTS